MNTKEIAQEILNQLKITATMPVIWSWGFNTPHYLSEEKMGDRYRLGGLQFKVQGRLFKGVVRVNLMADDTYTIQLGKITKGAFKASKEIANQYCDQFAETIDKLVETNSVIL